MIEVLERKIPVTSAIVDTRAAAKHLRIRQFVPVNLAATPWLEHVWSVQWDIPSGGEIIQRTVPFPAFNLVADSRKGCALFGCSSEYFEYRVTGVGQVVGFRFRAAGQSAFWFESASDLTDQSIPSARIFPTRVQDALAMLSNEGVNTHNIANALTALAEHAKPLPKEAKSIDEMVCCIKAKHDVYKVSDLSVFFKKSERSIQRQFARYLGLSPKLVIDRFRMHSALDALNCGTQLDFAELAQRLDYFDQSHFINAFKQMTGYSPKEYTIRAFSETL